MRRRLFELVPQCSLPSQIAQMPPLRLSDFRGTVLILSCVPSLDTPVCDRETRHWEEDRENLLRNDVHLLAVSLDLPFAQSRWCGITGVKHQMASGYRNTSSAWTTESW
jgi:thioredoxin-dependent peroxiredoxin